MSAATPSPVTPDVLRWAVEEDGRSLPELAHALKVEVDALDGWMCGDTAPSRGQVTSLAKVLQRPRALFFLPRPPASVGLPTAFRRPPGDTLAVSAAARRGLRQSRRLQHAVSWALRSSPSINVPSAGVHDDPEKAAAWMREWLAVTDTEQSSWRDDRSALSAWRQALEERGILVFILEIGRDEIRGFSAWDDRAPLIVSNLTGVAPPARIFTLAHELGHLAIRGDAACVEPCAEELTNVRVERWCERFGAALLMPSAAVRTLAAGRGVAVGGANLDDVRSVMRRFRVSARAAALRLIDLGYAEPVLYGQVQRTFVPAPRPPADAKIAQPPRAVARLRQYGPRTVRTVLTTLPPRDALSILRITVDDARRMANEVPGVPTF